MTQTQIKKKIEKLQLKIKTIESEIHTIQLECQHPNVAKKHGSSTGNWDRGDDCYWIDYNCPDCQKRWTEYS